jgi:hypothetical protein
MYLSHKNVPVALILGAAFPSGIRTERDQEGRADSPLEARPTTAGRDVLGTSHAAPKGGIAVPGHTVVGRLCADARAAGSWYWKSCRSARGLGFGLGAARLHWCSATGNRGAGRRGAARGNSARPVRSTGRESRMALPSAARRRHHPQTRSRWKRASINFPTMSLLGRFPAAGRSSLA